MPDINAQLLPNGPLRELLKDKENQETIRLMVAREIGYPVDAIAFIGQELDEELTDNCKPLRFTIEAGSKIKSEEEAERIAKILKEWFADHFPPLRRIEFDVWLLAHQVNGYAEHTPTTGW